MTKFLSYWKPFLEKINHTFDDSVEISTSNGSVSGKVYVIDDGRTVNAFLGVPFASCGTHDHRFQKPEKILSWKGTLKCTSHGPRAVQGDLIFDRFITRVTQDEANCLNMNIFSPSWNSKEFGISGRPVMVYVHGGGYMIHSASNYGDYNICKNICSNDVCVCVIQYRLGLFGFMTTGDKECPGNYGLWDQLMALRWIKDNIKYFGGDPENITVFGQSAGAAAIDLLSLSSYAESECLFSKIILMGGNANTDWALSTTERVLSASSRIAENSGWNENEKNSCNLLNFLKKSMPANLAPSLFGKSAFNRSSKGLELCPVIDSDLVAATPKELRKIPRKKLSIIIGASSCEALLFHALGRNQSDMESIQKLLHTHIPDSIRDAKILRDEAKDFYLRGIDVMDKDQVSRVFIQMYSDTLVNNSVQRYCHEMISQGHDIYLYNFNHFNPDEFGILSFRMPLYASTHCHEIRFLFGKGLYSKFRPNFDDLKVLRMTSKLFTNFAKYGNPSVRYEDDDSPEINWEKLTADNLYRCLEIGLDPKMNSDYQGRRYEFWKRIELLKGESFRSSA